MQFSQTFAFPPGWESICALLAIYVIYKVASARYGDARATPLAGPPSPSWLWGVPRLLNNPGSASIYDKWVRQYGSVFRVPGPLGSCRVVLTDPKAVAHFYSLNGWTYVWPRVPRIMVEGTFGPHALVASGGEAHRKQRRMLSPAFHPTVMAGVAPVYYDLAYKLKAIWDEQLMTSQGTALIDVEKWIERLTMDAIGIVGFSHDFGALDGKRSAVSELFDALGSIQKDPLALIVVGFGYFLPFLWRFSVIGQLQLKLGRSLEGIANKLLENADKDVGKEDKSIIGILVQAEEAKGLPKSVIVDHTKEVLLAGFESTAITFTWTIIELARHPEKQVRLRRELVDQFPNSDPTWEQLVQSSTLPYLDAVVHETLRLHPPVEGTVRKATKPDIIPLSTPLRTPDGKLVDRVFIDAGQEVTVSIHYMNTSTRLWGEDASEFKPERWLDQDGIPEKAQELQGYRHLHTFLDGHKMCIGRPFALAELKVILAVLVKNFAFELPNGPETQVELCRVILPRPRLAGEKGANFPMRVRRAE